MARPTKQGLEYFPLDVDIDQDDKVYLIEAKHGLIGFALIIRLLMKIYKNGYYLPWSEKETFILAKQTSVDVNTINNVVNDCINYGLFDKNLYEKYQILTSRGIQKRYFEACTRRKKVVVVREYLLIDLGGYSNIVFADINGINVSNNPVNDCNNPQSKVKESKVKKSTPPPPISSPSSIDVNVDINVDENTEEEEAAAGAAAANCNPYRFYEENFGTLSPHIAERIEKLEEAIGSEMVVEAMKEAVANRARGIKYVEAIVDRWLANNIRSPAALKSFEAERKRVHEEKLTPLMQEAYKPAFDYDVDLNKLDELLTGGG